MSNNLLMWVLLLTVFVLCLYWHITENNQLARQWHQQLGKQAAEWLVRFAWLRTAQLLLALASCLVVIIVYDWQLKEARQTIEDLKKTQTPLANKPSAVPTPAPAAATQPVQTAPSNNATNTVAASNYYPPRTPAPPTVEDVYSPEKSSRDTQSAMDEIKKRYEDILVIHMFLKKCGRVAPEDYHIITSALGQEMASVNAPGRLQYDILTAAEGSYKEVYSNSPCDDPSIENLYAQYTNYIKALSSNSPIP